MLSLSEPILYIKTRSKKESDQIIDLIKGFFIKCRVYEEESIDYNIVTIVCHDENELEKARRILKKYAGVEL